MARPVNRFLGAALVAFLFLDVSATLLHPAIAPPPSASNILQALRELRECGSVLYIAAHPDDENTQFIAYMAKERAMRTGYLSLTRGEGGQDLIGPDLGDPLGVIRTQELLAARRIDGGQQFFTRARDFGFSKDYEQTLAKWDRQEVLADMVHVIREFQPDVIVTRFPPEPGNTHGHHTASTVLALEAFKLAGDAHAFPEQLDGRSFPLQPWQPKRIFWNAFRGGTPDRTTLRLDIGGYLPLLGESVGEIAALSRSSHRSQGYGSVAARGARPDEFQPLDGKAVGPDLFTGIDTTWGQWTGLAEMGPLVDAIITRFDPMDPAASVDALFELRRRLMNASANSSKVELYWVNRKINQIDQLLKDCLGLYVETTVPSAEIIPGEDVPLKYTVVSRSNLRVTWKHADYCQQGELSLPPEIGPDHPGIALKVGQPIVADGSMTIDQPVSQPYWLRAAGSPGMYHVQDQTLIGQPENPPVLPVKYIFTVDGPNFMGGPLFVTTTPVQVTADPVKGEIRRNLVVVAPVALTPAHAVQLFAPGATHPVDMDITAYRAHQDGAISLNVPASWKVSPASQPFKLAAVGDHASFTFDVTAPPNPGTGNLTAQATIDGKTYDTSRQEIHDPYIAPQMLQPPARVKAVCLDLQIRGREIGYLPGAGDRVAEAITAMGYHVTPLTGADLTPERLHAFDAVVIGVRAFNVRTDLTAGLPALFAYVEGGGNVIAQYNTPGGLQTETLAPYDLKLSPNLPANRVTDENAPVTLLAPEHPAFNTPNKITAADFTGWVQERGLNFPSTWDQAHFTALLACSDPGEAPLKSGLLVAHYGKGYFVYTGLSFFRQLPAGVPGAYRLFANLVSLGK